MTTVTFGPSQPLGRRTIADANNALASGDIAQFEPIDQSGPFLTSTRLVMQAGVKYTSLSPGHKWGIQGMGGIDLGVNGVTLEWYLGDGANLTGSQGLATTAEAKNFTLSQSEFRKYILEAIKSTHGQWADVVAGVTPGTGPDDSGWAVSDVYIHDSAPVGYASNAWFHFGSGLVTHRVTFRRAGAGDHAFYPKGRGLRIYDTLFDDCVAPLSLRCGDQQCHRTYFDNCVNPVTSFPYDKTGLGGKQALYNTVLRLCRDGFGGGPLLFFDENNHEAGALLVHADYSVVVHTLTILDSSTAAQGFDFRDFTIAGRTVKLRNVAHGKFVTAPYRSGYTAANLDSDYNSYPNGGKPAAEAHSITPASNATSEVTLLPAVGSALLGAGTSTPDGTDFTPPRADIGFQGYPAPATGGVVTPVLEPTLVAQGSSATPGGTLSTVPLVGDDVFYALIFNQNNLGDLTVTPPSGYTLEVSRTLADKAAVYVVRRRWTAGDPSSGPITLPTWLIQDAVPVNQARGYETYCWIARGTHPTTPVAGSATNATVGGAGLAGNSGTTTIGTPPPGAWLVALFVGKPGQTPQTHNLDTANSIPTTGWTKRNGGTDVLQGTANGSASITGSTWSQSLATGVSSQAKVALTFTVAAQYVAMVMQIAPAAGGSSDTTPPDNPTNLRGDLAGTTVTVVADPTDYGTVGPPPPPPPPPGGGFADVGPPVNWWKLTTEGGLRPPLDSYDPTALFGPRTRDYYDNVALRAVDRGSAITGASATYYPRILGLTIASIDFSDPAHFKINIAQKQPPPSVYFAGASIRVQDISSIGGAAGAFKPKKPNGTYVVQSVTGTGPWQITFTTGANTTSGTYNPDSGFAIGLAEARMDTIYLIDVTEASIGSASDSHGPLFLPLNPAAPLNTPANPWVLQPGRCNNLKILGNSAARGTGKASLNVLIPPWFDVTNAAPEYATYGQFADPQLYNPYCHVEWTNVHLDVRGMGLKALTGGYPGTTPNYSVALGHEVTIHGVTYQGLMIPSGEAMGYGGCSGLVSQVMSHDFCYDANKFGTGATNLRWEFCSFFRNRQLVIAGGGHTDCFQFWDLINTTLGSFTDLRGDVWPIAPTWFRCYFESGGNAMLFGNTGGGSGTGTISDCWALECVAATGNKFCSMDGMDNPGARRCLVNGVPEGSGTPPMVGVRPTPLGLGNVEPQDTPPCAQDGNHPCSRGLVIWPDPTTAPDLANLKVNADGSTTPLDRPTFGAGDCGDPGPSGCYDYQN